MELRHLRYFVGVAREGNLTRAAARLRVAQPALSRQMHQLEEELGVRLFDREARGVKLTPAGHAFLAEAEAILTRSDKAVRVAQTSEQRAAGRLEVGYVWGLFHSLAPAWLARFRQHRPNVAVNLLDLSATEQAAALREGRLDLGLIGFAFEADAARLSKRKIGECVFMAALPAAHPQARKRSLPRSALAGECFVVISEQTYPGAAHVLKEACRQAGFRPRILQTAERGFTLLGLVAGNCGVTLLPESLQALPHPGVVFKPLADPPRGELFAAWKARTPSPLVAEFLQETG